MNTNLSHLAAEASPFTGTWSVMRSLLNVYSTMSDEKKPSFWRNMLIYVIIIIIIIYVIIYIQLKIKVTLFI